jgi:mannose-6-phosphate isomerase
VEGRDAGDTKQRAAARKQPAAPQARRDVSRAGLASAGFRAEGEDGVRPAPPRRIEKPWGYELVWAECEFYAGKLLVVRAGEALSLQFHEEKDETLYLLSGSVRVEVGTSRDQLRECPWQEGESLRIRPGVLHRMEALTDSSILEASTPELDDVVRVRDRYGRVAEGGGASGSVGEGAPEGRGAGSDGSSGAAAP